MRKFRKEGSVMLMSLFYFLFVALLAAVFIGLILKNETYHRVQEAVEVAARTRALAVDIPLKEHYGIIETYRDGKETQKYQTNYIEPDYTKSIPGYDHQILSPDSDEYKRNKIFAKNTAEQALIANLETTLGNNEKGESILNITKDNICFDVEPLPKGHKDKLNFYCDVTINGEKKTISANDVIVNGYTHPLNNSDDGNQRVYNVVFAGVIYEDKDNFFYRLLETIANGHDESKWGDPPLRAAYAIAYPQIDDCTSDEC